MDWKAFGGTAADLVHMVAEQVSVPGADKLAFHNLPVDMERQQPAV